MRLRDRLAAITACRAQPTMLCTRYTEGETRRAEWQQRAKGMTARRSTSTRASNEAITSHLASKNDLSRDFFFRIPKSGVLSNLRAGRAPIFGLSPHRAVSGL